MGAKESNYDRRDCSYALKEPDTSLKQKAALEQKAYVNTYEGAMPQTCTSAT
jgi:hypothetical protein